MRKDFEKLMLGRDQQIDKYQARKIDQSGININKNSTKSGQKAANLFDPLSFGVEGIDSMTTASSGSNPFVQHSNIAK